MEFFSFTFKQFYVIFGKYLKENIGYKIFDFILYQLLIN